MMDDDLILWRFGSENTLIAEIRVMAGSITVYDDVLDERFKNRLKVDHQTGSLIITNTRTEHTGLYQLQSNTVIKRFSLTVYGVFADSDAVKSVSVTVTEGDSVTLESGLTEIQKEDIIMWRFGRADTLIAQIDKEDEIFSTSHGDVVGFRDRLKLDHQTGSLTIMNTRTTDSGLYQITIKASKETTHRFRVTVYGVFADLDAEESVSVLEGDSVTLNSGLTKMMDDDLILWRFGYNKILIAKINVMASSITVYDDVLDGRFRDRLKVDHQTGSLIITNTRTEHTGLYQLQSNSVRKSFNLTVYARLPVPVISNSSNCSSSSSQQNCSLVCSVVNVGHVTLSWYKGNSSLSSISVSDLSISLSLPLEVEYQDKNSYSCVLNNPISNQTTHLNITQLCHTCSAVTEQSPSYPSDSVSLIVLVSAAVAGSLLMVAAVRIFCICRKHKKTYQQASECYRG
uniref:Ig-like domain-containing protein n=1 Tax=Cyprinus carpio TaxID=7962 RepID=A0A8C1KKB2_CYPCA